VQVQAQTNIATNIVNTVGFMIPPQGYPTADYSKFSFKTAASLAEAFPKEKIPAEL